MSVSKTPKSNLKATNLKGKSEPCTIQDLGNFICPNSLVSKTKPYKVSKNNSKKYSKNSLENTIQRTPVREVNKIKNNASKLSVTNLESCENKIKVPDSPEPFLTPSKPFTYQNFDIFPSSVTNPSRVIKIRNKLEKDSENSWRAVTPASRVKILKKISEGSTTNGNKTVTPAGRVIKKEIFRLVTPASRILKVPPKTNCDTKDTLSKNILPLKISNKPTMSRANAAMLSQSEKKPTRKVGKVISTDVKETNKVQKSLLMDTIQLKGDLASVKETAENKENAMKTPPTTHKVYVRPHTTRVISKTFPGSTIDNDFKEGEVLNKLRKVLTFGKNDDDEEEDGGEDSYSAMVTKTSKDCCDGGNDDKTEKDGENNDKDDDVKKPVDSVNDVKDGDGDEGDDENGADEVLKSQEKNSSF